ncbi:MAG: uroporphyrinogen methyltransferase / synthase [Thermacetogenium sp.]|uniref:uroporphyrinogen-III C-methyltransferase n=1 Tax=Thermacetogenium phaeum TaxID=85874 RepID=A0A101FGT7_9THEO|nr:MAG: Porphyrin biosynthesis protein HemD [Thermacetogenium phaeum]MDN5375834.1 uroporphyrinogen methyltransferase / synthase [Thermacetogenium sp.]
MNEGKGVVYLVGAGPGDPSLLTLKGLWCLERADVVIYDRLLCEYLLAFCRPDAEIIYVGKRTDCHTVPQEGINLLLAEKAEKGKTVCRLKGGDPFVFGRGGEEAAFLAERGIPFEIVPGVSSAVAVPAYAGIPVTHRDWASALAIVTGHRRQGGVLLPVRDTGNATAVFLMGFENLPAIVSSLLNEGWSGKTPAALIQWGTRADQQTVTGVLSDIEKRAQEAGIASPAVLVVGNVVRLREMLGWSERRPLFGKRILITRPRHQALRMAQEIIMLGGEPLCLPTIELVPADEGLPERIREQLPDYEWVIFTSANGVAFFLECLKKQQIDLRSLKGKLAAIGPATARALEERGLQVALQPREYRAEALLEELKKHISVGCRVLIPRAAMAREVLPEGLRECGAAVDVLPVYRTVPAGERERRWVEEQLLTGRVHYLTFTSSSTVQNFVNLFQPDELALIGKHTRIACVGPVTAATAHQAGLRVDVVSREYTIAGLLDAILADAGGVLK